ncbi:Helitron helicase-like protein, partial [Phytophthora palmivora]
MALTMMRICQKESWSFNGVDIQLQIGIHSGPDVNGEGDLAEWGYIDRTGSHSLLLLGGRLTQQYCVDQWAKEGMVQLYWLEGKNPTPFRGYQRFACTDVFSTIESAVEESIRAKDLTYKSPLHHRSDDYLGYMNAVEIRPLTLDFQRLILTPSFTGGPRYMYQRFQDAMAIVRELGAPNLFITMTCNPKWVEIQVKDTATEMERGFRTEHNRDSTPQFCVSLH